jgi:hypothetical protein
VIGWLSYDKYCKRWRFHNEGTCIAKKNYNELINLAIKKICTIASNKTGKKCMICTIASDKTGHFCTNCATEADKIIHTCKTKYFLYKNNYFVCYWKDNKAYFDIRHIIEIMNLSKSSRCSKYANFSKKIIYYKLHKNEYAGYIIRGLIGEETLYQLMLSSNSDISQSFKKDISKILVDLRNNDELKITNDKITLNKHNDSDDEYDSTAKTKTRTNNKLMISESKDDFKDKTKYYSEDDSENDFESEDDPNDLEEETNNTKSDTKIKTKTCKKPNNYKDTFEKESNNKIITKSSTKPNSTDFNYADILKQNVSTCIYDSIDDINYVQYLLSLGSNICIGKYFNKNVLYAFIIVIPNCKFIIIKFGFSEDIVDRYQSLVNEYKCKIFLVGLKMINRQKDERKFHDSLKRKYPHCIFPYTINGKEKTELYKLDPCLINEFNSLNVAHNASDDVIDNMEYSEDQQNMIDDIRKHQGIFLNCVRTNFAIDNKIRYDYLIARESNIHAQHMIDKEIELIKIRNKHEMDKNKQDM